EDEKPPTIIETIYAAWAAAGCPLELMGGITDGAEHKKTRVSIRHKGKCPRCGDDMIVYERKDGSVTPWCSRCYKAEENSVEGKRKARREILAAVGLKPGDCYRRQGEPIPEWINEQVIGTGTDLLELRPSLVECVTTFQRWLHMPEPGPLLVTLAA